MKKVAKQFLYEGLGFPVYLSNVRMIKSRDEWIPDIDFNQLQKAVLLALAKKSVTLTGNELRFIRKYFRKTLEAFGQEFGVSHVAVMDWEKAEDHPIKINPATEKCIRLFVIDSLKVGDHLFREGYWEVDIKTLANQQKTRKKTVLEPLTLDVQDTFLACG